VPDVNDKGMHWEKHWKKVANSSLLLSIHQPDSAEKQSEESTGNDISVTARFGHSKVGLNLYFSLNCKEIYSNILP